MRFDFTQPAVVRTLSSSAPIIVGEHALPLPLRAVRPAPDARAPGLGISPSNITFGDVFAVGTHFLEKALNFKDSVAEAREILSNGLYARRLRRDYEANSRAGSLYRYVFDAAGRDDLPPQAKLARREGDPATGNPEVDAAYDHFGIVFDFFRDELGILLKQPFLQVVNHNDDSWHPSDNNAMYLPLFLGARYVIYGPGDRHHRSLVHSLECVGHESMHQIMKEYFTDGDEEKFPYYGESGSLVEATCDIVGKCIKAKRDGARPPYTDDFWRRGAEYFISGKGSLGHMLLPGTAYDDFDMGSDIQVDHMSEFEVTEDDAGGVHINAGILERLFALFANSVPVPIETIPLKIWMKALHEVRPDPTFRDFGIALVQACQLYDELNKTRLTPKMVRACRTVGITDWIVHEGEVVKIAKIQRP